MIFVALETYGMHEVNEICKTSFVQGVVIGDVLCQKKMFEFGGWEMNDYIRQFVMSGKKVIFQTLMYATDRVFVDVINEIRFLVSENLLEAVLVQDIGVANKLHTLFPDVQLIWSKWGYARTPSINPATIEFYRTLGISAFECKNEKEVKYVQEQNFKPYYIFGMQTYLTINRECYFEFQHDIYDSSCGRKCLSKEKISILTQPIIDTTIDGKVLGLQYSYSENIDYSSGEFDIIAYADNWECIKEKLENM